MTRFSFKNRKEAFFQIVCFFVIGSFIGYLIEMLVAFHANGYFESRQGLVYGPFTPVYGLGAVLLLISICQFKNPIFIFCASFFIGGAFEYLCSYIQEVVFGTISWDYTNRPFNLHGRTSLYHSTCWGLLGIAFVKFVYPGCLALLNKLSLKGKNILLWCIIIFMSFDVTISVLAGIRQKERQLQIEASNVVEVFLDKHFPDERMDRIYANKKEVPKK